MGVLRFQFGKPFWSGVHLWSWNKDAWYFWGWLDNNKYSRKLMHYPILEWLLSFFFFINKFLLRQVVTIFYGCNVSVTFSGSFHTSYAGIMSASCYNVRNAVLCCAQHQVTSWTNEHTWLIDNLFWKGVWVSRSEWAIGIAFHFAFWEKIARQEESWFQSQSTRWMDSCIQYRCSILLEIELQLCHISHWRKKIKKRAETSFPGGNFWCLKTFVDDFSFWKKKKKRQ